MPRSVVFVNALARKSEDAEDTAAAVADESGDVELREASGYIAMQVSCRSHGLDNLPPVSSLKDFRVPTTVLALLLRQTRYGTPAALEYSEAVPPAAARPASALVITGDREPSGVGRHRMGQGGYRALSRDARVARPLSTSGSGISCGRARKAQRRQACQQDA